MPLTTAIAELVTVKQSDGKSKRYCHDLELRLGRLSSTMGERPAASIEGRELDAWLVGQPFAPGTRNTFRRHAEACLNLN